MSLIRLPAEQAVQRVDDFDCIIDTRSEAEFALDHLPGAVNWPSLHDAERARVGTLYKQSSAFEARKLGAALTARNIAAHIERNILDKPRKWQPLIYCWRGGQRSGALALILSQTGFHVQVIEGGYKAFRTAMRADLDARAAQLAWQVVCGPTGSGKTRLLQNLQAQGAQVLDLEALAAHRASVLGAIPGRPQPAQKQFEMRIWNHMRKMGRQSPVFVEAESKKVGNVTVPDALMQAMRASPCLLLELAVPERVQLLLEDYPYFSSHPQQLIARLKLLTALRGHQTIARWRQFILASNFEALVQELLELHYDPAYLRSTRRNFSQFGQAQRLRLPDRSAASFQAAATQLLA